MGQNEFGQLDQRLNSALNAVSLNAASLSAQQVQVKALANVARQRLD